MHETQVDGLTFYHDVPALGPWVAKNIAAMILRYADLASLGHLPPITLSGIHFAKAWCEIVGIEGCMGNSGPSEEERKRGGLVYECLFLQLPSVSSPRAECHPTTLEGVIAHEITHLRWKNLRHGTEFDARVLALLHGAKFPKRGGWNLATRHKVAQGREEADAWLGQIIYLRHRKAQRFFLHVF